MEAVSQGPGLPGRNRGVSGPAEREAQGPSGPAEREAQGPSGPAERGGHGHVGRLHGVSDSPRWDPETARGDAHEHYAGVPVAVVPGLHEVAHRQLSPWLPKRSRVADLGAGFGAFARRLHDTGCEVDAFDISADFFAPGLDDVKLQVVDFDGEFAAERTAKYDAVCAIEVIEHLENPRHFLREIQRMLVPGGILLLTTPNIECSVSRVLFMAQRRFLWFEDEWTYYSLGHITPLTSGQLTQMFAESGLTEVSHTTYRNPCDNPRIGWRTRLLARLVRGFRRPRWGDGEVHVYVVRRSLA